MLTHAIVDVGNIHRRQKVREKNGGAERSNDHFGVVKKEVFSGRMAHRVTNLNVRFLVDLF